MTTTLNKEASETTGVAEVTITKTSARPAGGKAKRKKDKAFYQEIGRKGGQRTREKHGSEFFSKIGTVGGTHLKEEKGIEFFRKIARIGRTGDKTAAP